MKGGIFQCSVSSQTDIVVEKPQAAYQYKIEASTDGSTWTPLVSYQDGASSGGRANLSDRFQVPARFVRLTITEVSGGCRGCFKDLTGVGQLLATEDFMHVCAAETDVVAL
jgi:hypothetical protein